MLLKSKLESIKRFFYQLTHIVIAKGGIVQWES